MTVYLLSACQIRQCDLQELFKHNTQPTLASLSDSGKLHTCQKSQLTEIRQAQVTLPDKEPQGSALINAIPPQSSKTFDDYPRKYILTKVNAYGAKYEHVDIIPRLQEAQPEV